MWWVIHMCRGFDPLFSLWQDRARSFWGTFSHPPTAKLSFGVQKLPIFTKIDLFGRQIQFFPRSFWVQFSAASGTPPSVFRPSTPPGPNLVPCAPCLQGPNITVLATVYIYIKSFYYFNSKPLCNMISRVLPLLKTPFLSLFLMQPVMIEIPVSHGILKMFI